MKSKNIYLKTCPNFLYFKSGIKFALNILSILYTSYSYAGFFVPTSENDCTTVDLRQDFYLKMRNQQETSWCFAHAASDLLQFTYKIPEQISAADIAINYSETNVSKTLSFIKKLFGNHNQTPAETGFIKLAIDDILPQGYCPESSLPSEKWLKIEGSGTQAEIEITEAISETLALQEKIHRDHIQTSDKLPWYFKFENITKETFFDILSKTSRKKLFAKIRESACFNHRKPFSNSIINTKFSVKNKNIIKSIHQKLTQRLPVTIDFFSDVLRNYENPKKRIDELHTVLIYGRKFDHKKEQCMLLVKDSYGEQCKKYDQSIECEGGNLWLSEEKIFNSMTSSLKIMGY